MLEWHAQRKHWRDQEYAGGTHRRDKYGAGLLIDSGNLGPRWYNRVRGFAYFLIGQLTMPWVFRPLIGGVLSRPQDRWPNAFSHPFWAEYPYFLPCVGTATYTLISFILTAMFLKEVSHLSLSLYVCVCVCLIVLTARYPDSALRPFNKAEPYGS